MKKASASNIPEKFGSILCDFANDLSLPFPEYEYLWSKWRIQENIPESMLQQAFYHCQEVYPERFFDILYQNDDIFLHENKVNTCFLPNVDFKILFNSPGVTETTKNAMWKYIQLLLFTVIGNIKDKSDFGKSMNLFEGIDENELQEKIAEAMKNMSDFFTESTSTSTEKKENEQEEKMPDFANFEKTTSAFFEKMEKEMGAGAGSESGSGSGSEESKPKFDFNPEDIHNHLKGLFDGKLGSLAKELIEELTDDLKEALGLEDLEDSNNPKDVFKKLMKNPAKLMELVKKISGKFQEKMKRGDISQEEIMKEATEMLKKMKEMGGDSKQMNEMFQNMAKSMGGSTKNMKVDTNAVNRMMKTQSIKERLRAKMEQKKQAEFELKQTENPNHIIYTPLNAEKAEKSKKEEMDEIDAIVASIEGVGEKTKNKKKKKGKK
jgi:hypothetical protein